MILDVQIRRGAASSDVAELLSRCLKAPVAEDRFGNPMLRLDSGEIVIADDSYNAGQVYAEVRARDSVLANRVYDVLVDNTAWDLSLVDSTDNNPEDVVLRHRDASAA
ncbi:hypothetical protein [Mycolicibacterium brumae]|uniref:hypothetical protein n=1 Tax=Mycolicibacterium brumae TaxID=85968 RepID=UPI000AD01916|nr:hypothetical protein [Mycolicibacterium brumae]MCV7194478.1 hypothetical protein [Mycolicibacterium brumae]UWW10013.1 hypothetical protein L2Z93_003131 [Mycolicibacterium brumae]